MEPEKTERNAEILALRAEGVTMELIAAIYGITRERVYRICKRAREREERATT